jgi:release factor glutamine methyltransferase
LAEATGWDRAQIAADPGSEISPAATRRFAEMVRRRLRREPVAYILGRGGFRYLELSVDPRVLIPRPETELLVELALELRPRSVLDVGTGSGAIALAIAAELPGCEVTATDTSPAALDVARANAERLGLASRVKLVAGTLPPDGGFELAVANLPYVSEAEWEGLEPEVAKWEPREALLAGPDGLDALRATIPALAGVADIVALEVGVGQAAEVAGLLIDAGLGAVETRADLAQIDRVVIGRRGAGS